MCVKTIYSEVLCLFVWHVIITKYRICEKLKYSATYLNSSYRNHLLYLLLSCSELNVTKR